MRRRAGTGTAIAALDADVRGAVDLEYLPSGIVPAPGEPLTAQLPRRGAFAPHLRARRADAPGLTFFGRSDPSSVGAPTLTTRSPAFPASARRAAGIESRRRGEYLSQFESDADEIVNGSGGQQGN